MNRRTIQTLDLYFIYFSVNGKLDRDCAYLQLMFYFKTQITATDKAFKSSSQQKKVNCHNCEHYYKSILCSILRKNTFMTIHPELSIPSQLFHSK